MGVAMEMVDLPPIFVGYPQYLLATAIGKMRFYKPEDGMGYPMFRPAMGFHLISSALAEVVDGMRFLVHLHRHKFESACPLCHNLCWVLLGIDKLMVEKLHRV